MTWRSVTFVVWGMLGLAALALIVLAVTGRGGLLRRPFVPVRAYLAGHRTVRLVVLIAWAWAGWHFFAR
jgi:uncharacterized protein DUF6186